VARLSDVYAFFSILLGLERIRRVALLLTGKRANLQLDWTLD
jgi:hypothetical protein